MRRLRTTAFVLTLAMATLAWADADPNAQWKSLESEFQAAVKAYYAPMAAAKTKEERAAIKLDPAADPRRTFAPRLLEFERTVKGTDAGAKALATVIYTAGALGADGEPHIKEAQTRLVAEYANSTGAEDLVWRLALRPQGPQGLDAEALLGAFRKSTNESVQAALAHAEQAKVMYDRKATAEAKSAAVDALEKVAGKYPNTAYGKKARGSVNAERLLVVGKPALDFQAVDPEGKSFRLSDYRGKAVLLDFWGFW